jgi:3-methyladenine DNA glycosylase/8-oxoguanine DNA glycosylase
VGYQTLRLDLDGDLDFGHALETYVIYPWVRDGDELVRPLRAGPGDAVSAVARIRRSGPRRLQVRLLPGDLASAVRAELRAALVRCLRLEPPYAELDGLAAADPVLAAALRHRGRGMGKLYPDLFEALCGVVCAQRTTFTRIYSMMRNLALAFGEPTPETVDGAVVHAFPTPAGLAATGEADLRECRVGFRAKTLAHVARFLADRDYSWHHWRARRPGDVIAQLLDVHGIGPYTANLAVNLSYGRGGTPHVDSYVTHVVGTLYLNDPAPTAERVTRFLTERWGPHAEAVLDLLTTDTEIWGAELGADIAVRSGARGRLTPTRRP